MYELENDSCADPYQPGIVNCLDGFDEDRSTAS